MEVRGYVIGAKRTKIDQYSIGFSDVATLLFAGLFLFGIIYMMVIL
jgi:energy-coupling factor transport system permease protein